MIHDNNDNANDSDSDNGENVRPRSLLILGCGDLGLRLARKTPSTWRVTGIRRNITKLPEFIGGLAADYTRAGSLGMVERLAPDYVVTTLKPAGRDPAGYSAGFASATRNLLAGLGTHRPRALLMVSSTRVYAERDGGWVDENSPLNGSDAAASAIVEAEQALLGSGHSAAVLRCGGIYGDSNSRLLTRIEGGSICAARPVHYTNRIHRDDVAGFLWHLLELRDQAAPLRTFYNTVDDHPAPQHEVEQWLAKVLGVQVKAHLEPGASHKRCRNRALTGSGYHLRYPDYRSGYTALLAARGSGPDSRRDDG